MLWHFPGLTLTVQGLYLGRLRLMALQVQLQLQLQPRH